MIQVLEKSGFYGSLFGSVIDIAECSTLQVPEPLMPTMNNYSLGNIISDVFPSNKYIKNYGTEITFTDNETNVLPLVIGKDEIIYEFEVGNYTLLLRLRIKAIKNYLYENSLELIMEFMYAGIPTSQTQDISGFKNSPFVKMKQTSQTIFYSNNILKFNYIDYKISCSNGSSRGEGCGFSAIKINFEYYNTRYDRTDTFTFPTGNPCLIGSYGFLGGGIVAYTQHEKGEYKGMPESIVPLRQFIRNGIDYRKNIDLYDETNYRSRNMFLTNYIGTVGYSCVRYSSPNGAIRVSDSVIDNFTHFVGCGFGDDNTPRVYRVTGYNTIGNGVVEYEFTLDYYHDYWQHYGITTDNDLMVVRTSDETYYRKEMSDSLIMYDGTSEHQDFFATIVQYYYAMVLNTINEITGQNDILFLSPNAYKDFCEQFLSFEGQSSVLGIIRNVYLVPNGSLSFTKTSINSWNFNTLTTTFNFTTSHSMYKLILDNESGLKYNNYIHYSIDCSNFSYENVVEYQADYTLHVPCYGDIKPSSHLIQGFDTQNTMGIRYYIDFISGTVAIGVTGEYDSPSNFVNLPVAIIPTNESVESIRNIYGQDVAKESGFEAQLFTSGALLATSFLTANPALAVAGGISIASTIGNAVEYSKNSDNNREHVKNTSGLTAKGGHGYSSILDRYIHLMRDVPNVAMNLNSFYERMGYPCYGFFTALGGVSGNFYQFKCLKPLFGTDEYASMCLKEIEKDYCYYNY